MINTNNNRVGPASQPPVSGRILEVKAVPQHTMETQEERRYVAPTHS